jgi:hypothetical protein
MRVGAAKECRVHCLGELDVADKNTAACQQPMVFDPRNTGADQFAV